MARILPLCLAFLVSLQQVGGHSTWKGKSNTADNLKCIYYNKEYVNCTWKRSEEAAHGVNDTFYYWFSKPLRKTLCSPMNQSEHISCGLAKEKKPKALLCLIIKTSNNFTVLPLNCFQRQDYVPHRLTPQKEYTGDLNCTYSDDGYLNCTWEQGKDAVHNISYEVYYRFSQTALKMKQCRRYLQNRSLNVGCHLTTHEIGDNLNWFYAHVIDSNNFTIVKPRKFLLDENVKMYPPQNLSVKFTGMEELSLAWDIPKNQNPKWLQYEMEYKSNMDSDWQVKHFEEKPFTLPSVDPAKCYFFHLRSKMNAQYAQESYWSEWGPMLILKNKIVVDSCPSRGINALYLVLLPVAVLTFVVLAYVLFKVKRVKALLVPGIPDPKHLFVDLFEEYNGNFQEWISVAKDLHMDFQSNCIPIECRIEEEPVRQKMEQEDPRLPLTGKIGSIESLMGSLNEEKEKPAEDLPNSQFLVCKTATIDMSKAIMNENMYIRL